MINAARIILVVLLGSSAAFAPGARAAETTAPGPSEEQSVQAYGAADKACGEWSDGCVTCLRTDPAAPACSLTGIACQPGPIACERAADPAKPH